MKNNKIIMGVLMSFLVCKSYGSDYLYNSNNFIIDKIFNDNIINEDAAKNDDLLGNLSVRVRNEFRNAKRSSSSTPFIDAWVSGILLDYESPYFWNFVGADFSYHRVDKIKADAEKTTRFYLNDHSSFNRGFMPSLKFKYKNNKLRIGRFSVDYAYGGWDYEIPMITSGSVRTLPNMKEGIFYSGKLTNNWNIYSMVTLKNSNSFSVQKWEKSGVMNSKAETINKEPHYALATIYDRKDLILKLGLGVQKEVRNEIQGIAIKSFKKNPGEFYVVNLLGYYAELNGETKKAASNYKGMDAENLYILSGQFSYINGPFNNWVSVGYVSDRVSPTSGINTDMTYVAEQSIDRNLTDQYSYQFGSIYSFSKNFSAGGFVCITDGYADNTKTTKVEGIGFNVLASYKFKGTTLDGLSMTALINKAKEERSPKNGNSKSLDYYDVKLIAQYKFDINPYFSKN